MAKLQSQITGPLATGILSSCIIIIHILVNDRAFVKAKGLVGKVPGNPATCQEEPCSSDPQHVLQALKYICLIFALVLCLPVVLYWLSKFITWLHRVCNPDSKTASGSASKSHGGSKKKSARKESGCPDETGASSSPITTSHSMLTKGAKKEAKKRASLKAASGGNGGPGMGRPGSAVIKHQQPQHQHQHQHQQNEQLCQLDQPDQPEHGHELDLRNKLKNRNKLSLQMAGDRILSPSHGGSQGQEVEVEQDGVLEEQQEDQQQQLQFQQLQSSYSKRNSRHIQQIDASSLMDSNQLKQHQQQHQHQHIYQPSGGSSDLCQASDLSTSRLSQQMDLERDFGSQVIASRHSAGSTSSTTSTSLPNNNTNNSNSNNNITEDHQHYKERQQQQDIMRGDKSRRRSDRKGGSVRAGKCNEERGQSGQVLRHSVNSARGLNNDAIEEGFINNAPGSTSTDRQQHQQQHPHQHPHNKDLGSPQGQDLETAANQAHYHQHRHHQQHHQSHGKLRNQQQFHFNHEQEMGPEGTEINNMATTTTTNYGRHSARSPSSPAIRNDCCETDLDMAAPATSASPKVLADSAAANQMVAGQRQILMESNYDHGNLKQHNAALHQESPNYAKRQERHSKRLDRKQQQHQHQLAVQMELSGGDQTEEMGQMSRRQRGRLYSQQLDTNYQSRIMTTMMVGGSPMNELLATRSPIAGQRIGAGSKYQLDSSSGANFGPAAAGRGKPGQSSRVHPETGAKFGQRPSQHRHQLGGSQSGLVDLQLRDSNNNINSNNNDVHDDGDDDVDRNQEEIGGPQLQEQGDPFGQRLAYMLEPLERVAPPGGTRLGNSSNAAKVNQRPDKLNCQLGEQAMAAAADNSSSSSSSLAQNKQQHLQQHQQQQQHQHGRMIIPDDVDLDMVSAAGDRNGNNDCDDMVAAADAIASGRIGLREGDHLEGESKQQQQMFEQEGSFVGLLGVPSSQHRHSVDGSIIMDSSGSSSNQLASGRVLQYKLRSANHQQETSPTRELHPRDNFQIPNQLAGSRRRRTNNNKETTNPSSNLASFNSSQVHQNQKSSLSSSKRDNHYHPSYPMRPDQNQLQINQHQSRMRRPSLNVSMLPSNETRRHNMNE